MMRRVPTHQGEACGCQEHHSAEHDNGRSSQWIVANESCRERCKADEQQEQSIQPQEAAIDILELLKEIVVRHPKDENKQEAYDPSQYFRQDGVKRLPQGGIIACRVGE